MTGSGGRALSSWIDGFCEYFDVIASPSIFRTWAAIGVLSSVLERKVWVYTKGSNLYPNLYIVLVGPPGVGKSNIISKSEEMVRRVPGIHVTPSSVTTASLVDTLADSKRRIANPGQTPEYMEFHYATVVASELQNFLPAYEPEFMGMMTKLYDGEPYDQRRRGNKLHIKLEMAQLSILAGTTPSYLNAFLPEGAWDQGFTSRTVFVFHGDKIYTPIFSEEGDFKRLEHLFHVLNQDLLIISKMIGKLSWTPEAAAAITEWDKAGGPPVPDHNKLTHYVSRRTAQLIKLCIIASISRTSDKQITLEDYQIALGWLLQAEALMPDIFTSMGGISADSKAMEDAWYMAIKYGAKHNRAVPEHMLIAFLRDRVPSYSIMKAIEIMISSKMLERVSAGYKAIPKS